MRLDDLRAELDDLAARTLPPAGDVAGALRSGRARRARRRAGVSGFVVVVVAAVVVAIVARPSARVEGSS